MSNRQCAFSGFRIPVGHGFSFVRGDAKIYHFINWKSASAFERKSNPRRIAWTAVYRRLYKKSADARGRKKKTRRTTRVQRAIVGASLDVLKARRQARPERSAQKDAALREIKQKKKAARAGQFSRARGGSASRGGRVKSTKLQRGGRR